MTAQRTIEAAPEAHPVPSSASGDRVSNRDLYFGQGYFDAEMEALAGSAWQFVCTLDDLANANDWVRRRVFGVDIFVQNFVGTLRGYQNVCQHRGFPLRREARGNGPVQCQFHGWAYHPNGKPVGIPRNKELFCLSREQQAERALPEIRVATVGQFVFVALRPSVPPIEDYLGRYGPLLQAVSAGMRTMRDRWSGVSKANWKLCFEVTLDDYHVQFVHSTTLGAEAVPIGKLLYGREGYHSHMFGRRDDDWQFPGFWENVAAGKFDYSGYKIHQLFPNLLVVTSFKMVLITVFSPLGPNSTEVFDLMFDLKANDVDQEWWDHIIPAHRKVSAEDRDVSEAQQEVIGQFERPPLFGKMEERVAWFHESYEQLVGAPARQLIAG